MMASYQPTPPSVEDDNRNIYGKTEIPKFDLDSNCTYCNIKFGWIWHRRHHCRWCGQSVCHDCANISEMNDFNWICNNNHIENCHRHRCIALSGKPPILNV
jgi:hypothetical protein